MLTSGAMNQAPGPAVRHEDGWGAAWRLLLGLRALVRAEVAIPEGAGIALDGEYAHVVGPDHPDAMIRLGGPGGWQPVQPVFDQTAPLFDLYLPLCLASPVRPHAVAHLGQSLDGRIATESGLSQFINGADNITHLHRMRALADAVVVGAGTIEHDDPRLTTRLVPGDSPVRVVVDRRRRLSHGYNVFSDRAARTIIACETACAADGAGGPAGEIEVVGVPSLGAALSARALLDALNARGLNGVFIEGGGVTVSHFLNQGALDRLQVAVAPLIIGSGRPSITLPPIEDLADGLRPEVRSYPMGADVLFDCILKP